jgi:hypothetical protein
MAAAFVQATFSTTATGSAVATNAFAGSTTTGNAILVAVTFDFGGSPTLNSVSDNKGNTYTFAGPLFLDSNNNQSRHAYCLNAAGGAGHTVTANFSSSVGFIRIVAHEVSGLLTSGALDQIATGAQATATSITSTSVTTTTDGQYIFASGLNAGGTASDGLSASAPFTEPANSTSVAANNEEMAAYYVQPAAGAITATMTRASSGLMQIRVTTWKAVSAPAALVAPLSRAKLWMRPWQYQHVPAASISAGTVAYTLPADPGAITLAGQAAALTYTPVAGAIVQTGTNLDFHIVNTAASGTVSSTITVPSDATFMVVGVSAYQGSDNGHYGGMTFTKGGADTAMSGVLGADSGSKWQTVMYYLAQPDTGTNKTLKWSWANTSADSRMLFSITFWKGVNLTTPVRDSNGAQGGSWPRDTPPLTVVSGDTIAAFSGFFYGPGDGTGSVTDWDNLTEIAECATGSSAEATWAKTDIASGNVAGIYLPSGALSSSTNDAGSSYRIFMTALSGGTQVRATFKSGTGGPLTTLHCSIGIRSGSSGTATTATPVELTFSGASGFTIGSASSTITSDWVSLSFSAGDVLVVVQDNASLSNEWSNYWNTAPAGAGFQYKASTASWNSSSNAGFNDATAGTAVSISRLEVQGSGTIAVGVQACTGSEGGITALVMRPATTGAYTLTTTKGSIALSGSTTYFDANRILAAAAGSIVVGGTATGLKYGRMLTATKGSIVLGGIATGLLVARRLAAAIGPIVLAGTATGLKYGRMLTAASSTITLAGLATALRAARFVRAVVGPIVLAGMATNLVYTSARKLIADLGAIVVSGSNTSLNYGSGRTIVASTGSIAVSGTATALRVARQLAAVKGSIVLAGPATALRAARGLAAAAGAITVTGISTAVLRYARKLVATVGPIVLGGVTTGLRRAITLAAVKGSITLAGSAANLLYTVVKRLVAVTGTITLFGPTVGLDANRVVTAIKGSIILAGQAVLLLRGKTPFVAATGSITVAGQAANLVYRASYRMQATSASIRVAGREAGLSRSGTEQPGVMEFGRKAYLRRW